MNNTIDGVIDCTKNVNIKSVVSFETFPKKPAPKIKRIAIKASIIKK